MIERAEPLHNSLSPREKQLLVHAAKGFTDQGIAHKLGISLATVGTYWGRIRIKMGPLNRTELVAHFLQDEASTTVDELKHENERLLLEISEQARTASMLQAALEMFRGLLDTAPDAIVVVDQDGVIQIANELAEELFGYKEAELLGINVEQLIPERYRSTHPDHRRNYLQNPTKRRMGEHLATTAKKRDGTEFTMATALSATQTPSGTLVTCIIRDLSGQLEQHETVAEGAD